MSDLFDRELCMLAQQLHGSEIRLIVGGGYGLVLRQRFLRSQEPRGSLRPYPIARSTADIDLFLPMELLVDAERMKSFRQALEVLGYQPVESAKYYQFVREVQHGIGTRLLKFDLLADVPRGEQERKALRADKRRVRNRSVERLHAHSTPEALTIEQHLLAVEIHWQDLTTTVHVPHPYSYLLLKLFALRDQIYDERKDFGRHHAFDLYATVAMMTREEWDQAVTLKAQYATTPQVEEASAIVREFFSNVNSLGVIRFREHLLQTSERMSADDLERFSRDLSELFPPA